MMSLNNRSWLTRLAMVAALIGWTTLPSMAAELSPEGSWQQANGDTRVKVTLCGDGTELCAKLTWLSEKAKSPDTLKYLNAFVVSEAHKLAENAWKGEVHFMGATADGTIKLLSQNTIELSGCKLGFCQSVRFRRI